VVSFAFLRLCGVYGLWRPCRLHKPDTVEPPVDFSVQPLCSLCLCGDFLSNINHRDTETPRRSLPSLDGMVVANRQGGHDINFERNT